MSFNAIQNTTVFQCPAVYDSAEQPWKEAAYGPYWAWFPYPLHAFQRWSVEAIVRGKDLLVCAPTGSGKTMPAEFAARWTTTTRRKKVIYTSPIKALSNEKYHCWKEAFPDLSIGLVTGDIQRDTNADILIMTTEILLSQLQRIHGGGSNRGLATAATVTPSRFTLEMDIATELGCVIMDEIHMIQDESRGKVWEECIMLLPPHIPLIGLSATIDHPLPFASWLAQRRLLEKGVEGSEGLEDGKHVEKGPLYFTQLQKRAVPLLHHAFVVRPAGTMKVIRDKGLQAKIKECAEQPLLLLDAQNRFQSNGFRAVQFLNNLFDKHRLRAKRSLVLNTLCTHLVEQERLPALCYVFSRRALECCANEITVPLLEFDSKVAYTVDRACEQLLRDKLPNFHEYLHLPEYEQLVHWLRKGIAIHHAGMLPVLRELVECMFRRGFVKLLFCTETMSVGINLPAKTTIFTSLHKHNGAEFRPLRCHEYTQAAGRAGRLGLDTVGYVYHCSNLCLREDTILYQAIMHGTTPPMQSHFAITPEWIMRHLGKESDGKESDGKESDGKESDGKESDGKESDSNEMGEPKDTLVSMTAQWKRSFASRFHGARIDELTRLHNALCTQAKTARENLPTQLRTPRNILETYQGLMTQLSPSNAKKIPKKHATFLRSQCEQWRFEYPHIDKDCVLLESIAQQEKEAKAEEMRTAIDSLQSEPRASLIAATTWLMRGGWIEPYPVAGFGTTSTTTGEEDQQTSKDNFFSEPRTLVLTDKGRTALCFKYLSGMLWTEWLRRNADRCRTWSAVAWLQLLAAWDPANHNQRDEGEWVLANVDNNTEQTICDSADKGEDKGEDKGGESGEGDLNICLSYPAALTPEGWKDVLVELRELRQGSDTSPFTFAEAKKERWEPTHIWQTPLHNWCAAQSAEECKLVLQELQSVRGISVGEWVKQLLHWNEVVRELTLAAESMCLVSIAHVLQDVPAMTLKFVATNQSLYV